ncbi:hypothetical protein RJ641_029964 [Dillenia turbinata]|uniref:Uncharacterized protein n=1 Tax=Dillenia turbinata TaxID=194707 RepID=A0AAN8VSS1_9MAGN
MEISILRIQFFVGLSLAVTKPTSPESRDECNADEDMAKRVVIYEVISFSFFLFSSLIAKILEVFLNCHTRKELRNPIKKVVRIGMLILSVIASVTGILFLVFSMVYVIQFRLGKLSCGSDTALFTAISMISIVSTALIIFSIVVPNFFSNQAKKFGSEEECQANANMAQRLVVCEVISFSFFLFSSLVASLNCHNIEELKHQINKVLMVAMLLLSVCASIVHILFLVLFMVDVVQV